MDLSTLGYTQKWIDYGFITPEFLTQQIDEFNNSEDKNTEHYRLGALSKWLSSTKVLNISEIEQYMEVAKEDPDKLMAGTAMKELFTSTIITDSQFKFLKRKLPEFGEWTKKLIQFEDLTKRINNEPITEELFDACFKYKKEFRDNRLIVKIIKTTDNEDLLLEFETNGSGKQLRTLAQKRLNSLRRKTIG